MTRLSNYFYNKASLLTAIILTILTFSYLFLVMTDIAKGFEIVDATTQSLAMSFGFSYEMVEAYLSIRTAEMISVFIEFNRIWDNIFALLYGLMYILWISLLFKPYSAKAKWLNLFPITQTIFDWLENFQLAKLATYYLENPRFVNKDFLPSSWGSNVFFENNVQFASIFGMAKWTASTLIFIIVFVGIILKTWTAIKNRK
jgi:hypothetical protein